MRFDPERNKKRNINVRGILNGNPTDRVWLIGFAYLKASDEDLQLLNKDVRSFLIEVGLVKPTDRKPKTDISNAFEQTRMLERRSTNPTIRVATESLGPFVRNFQEDRLRRIGAEAVQKAWEKIRIQIISRLHQR